MTHLDDIRPRLPVLDGDVIVSRMIGWPQVSQMWTKAPEAWEVSDVIRCMVVVAAAKAVPAIVLFAPADVATLSSICLQAEVELVGLSLSPPGFGIRSKQRSTENDRRRRLGQHLKGEAPDPARWEAELMNAQPPIVFERVLSVRDWIVGKPHILVRSLPLVIVAPSGSGKTHYTRILMSESEMDETIDLMLKVIAEELRAILLSVSTE